MAVVLESSTSSRSSRIKSIASKICRRLIVLIAIGVFIATQTLSISILSRRSPCERVCNEINVAENNKLSDVEIHVNFSHLKKTTSDRSNSSIILTDKIFNDSIETSTSGSTSYGKNTSDFQSTLDAVTTSVPAQGTSLKGLILKAAEGTERPRRQEQPPCEKRKTVICECKDLVPSLYDNIGYFFLCCFFDGMQVLIMAQSGALISDTETDDRNDPDEKDKTIIDDLFSF